MLTASVGVGIALVVALLWWRGKRDEPTAVAPAIDSTVTIRITKHDALGMPEGKPIVVRDRDRVHKLIAALGVDSHKPMTCPSDYASADVGIILSGVDVYSKRNVYVWNLKSSVGSGGEAGAATAETRVVTSTSSGCREGAPENVETLRRLIDEASLDAGTRR